MRSKKYFYQILQCQRKEFPNQNVGFVWFYQVPSENTKDSTSNVDLTVESPSSVAEKSSSTAQLKPAKSKMQIKKSKDKMATAETTTTAAAAAAAAVSFTDVKQTCPLNYIKWKLLSCADSIVREMLKVTIAPKTSTDCKWKL